MKTRRRETRARSHRPCWFPNRRRAEPQRVSNPDYAGDARQHSRRGQDRLLAAPSVSAVTVDCALARWQALSRELLGKRLSCKSVADPGLRLNQRWFCWIRLDLLAKMRDVNA